MEAVLSIAGSDCSGGAGIQADIKTIEAHMLYAETVITSLTAQNTTGVYGIYPVDPSFVAQQIDVVFDDICPDAVKIGMLGTADVINVVAERLQHHKACNIVVDPVLGATSGSALMEDDAPAALLKKLMPLAKVVTPNIPETEALCGLQIANHNDMREAAYILKESCPDSAILVKGGHRIVDADDFLLTEHGREVWMRHKHIETPNTHGTGCTLSSAIACNLAQGAETQAAVQKAKNYVTAALLHDLGLGKGSGPLNHMWNF